MSQLFEDIKRAVADDRYVIGVHAAERLDERGIPDWQVVAGVEDGELVRASPDDLPNPVVEIEQTLPDGTPVKAVWAWLPVNRAAKLVTVHYLD